MSLGRKQTGVPGEIDVPGLQLFKMREVRLPGGVAWQQRRKVARDSRGTRELRGFPHRGIARRKMLIVFGRLLLVLGFGFIESSASFLCALLRFDVAFGFIGRVALRLVETLRIVRLRAFVERIESRRSGRESIGGLLHRLSRVIASRICQLNCPLDLPHLSLLAQLR